MRVRGDLARVLECEKKKILPEFVGAVKKNPTRICVFVCERKEKTVKVRKREKKS